MQVSNLLQGRRGHLDMSQITGDMLRMIDNLFKIFSFCLPILFSLGNIMPYHHGVYSAFTLYLLDPYPFLKIKSHQIYLVD